MANEIASAILTLKGTLAQIPVGIKSVAADMAMTVAAGYNAILTLGDAAGAKKLSIVNSSAAEVASIDSLGNAKFLKVSSTGGEVAPTSVNFAAGHADYTLSATEKLAKLLLITNASQAANVILPAETRMYVVNNTSGFTITLKASGQTGVAVTNNKTAVIIGNGTDFIRVTADT
jgi:hypothetical protein